MDYSIVIPLYNESQNIEVLHQRIQKVMQPFSDSYEVIFIDDGSTDGSYSVLKKIALSDAHVRVLSFDRNYGQHPATVAGFEASKGEYVITLDSDLQNPPEEIPRMVEKARQGYDMVAGRRGFRKDTYLRKASSSLVNLYFGALTGVYLKDYGTSLRVFRGKTAKEISEKYHKERLYIPVLLLKITKNVAEIETGHDERLEGESRYNLWRLFIIIWRITLRFNAGLCGFFKKLRLIREDGPLYKIDRSIVNKEELSLT